MGWLKPDALIKLLAGKANKLSLASGGAGGEGLMDGTKEGRNLNGKSQHLIATKVQVENNVPVVEEMGEILRTFWPSVPGHTIKNGQ